MADPLPTWHDGPTKTAILDFVARVSTSGGPDFVPPAERVAVFDNDGTLWCEKPMQVEIGFLLERLQAMAEADAALRDRQPWKAAYEHDYAWLGTAMTKHYEGDDVGRILGPVQHGAGALVPLLAARAAAEPAVAMCGTLKSLGHRLRPAPDTLHPRLPRQCGPAL